MWIFSNREIVTIVLFFVFIVLAISYKNVRDEIPKLLKCMFAYKLVIVFVYAFCVFVSIIFIISKVIKYDLFLLKDSIFWFFTIGLGFIFGNINGSKFAKTEIVNNVIIDPLKLTVIFQFMVSSYVFPLLIETIQIPIITFLIILEVFSKGKKEYEPANKLFNTIISILGLYLIVYVIICAIKDYTNLFSIKTLISYFLPTIYTILFIPFAYFIVLLSKYETQFIRYNYISNKKLIFYLKVRIILYAKLSLQKINGLCSVLNYNYYDINTKKDVNDYILILKANRNKIEV